MISVALYANDPSLHALLVLLLGNTEGFRLETGSVSRPESPTTRVALVDADFRPEGQSVGRLVETLRLARQRVLVCASDAETLFASLAAGADGYLLRRDLCTHLLPALREIIDGGAPLSRSIARRVVQTFSQSGRAVGNRYGITPREGELLERLANGLTYRQIGSECGISVETVRRHLKNCYGKLRVGGGTAAVAKAIREGVIGGRVGAGG